jgi:hypothetical protein
MTKMQRQFRTDDRGLTGTLSTLEDLNGRLQPKPTSYCWSDRTIVAVLVAKAGQYIRVRMRRARSYHGGGVSPSLWLEMKAFPKGDAGGKLTRCAAVAGGRCIPVEVTRTCPRRDSSVNAMAPKTA